MSTVEIDLMRYEAQVDRECRREDAIIARQEELLTDGGDCDPYNADNFCEAMKEMSVEKRQELDELLNAKHPDMTAIGNLVFDFCFDYWCQEADTRAADIVEGCR